MELIAVALVVVGFIIFMRIPPKKDAKKLAPKQDNGNEIYIMKNGEMFRVIAVEKVEKKPETKKEYRPRAYR